MSHPSLHKLEKAHCIKISITVGCVVSSAVCLVYPDYQTHGTIIAVVTNLVWVWA